MHVGEQSIVTARDVRAQGHERAPFGHQAGQDALRTPGWSLSVGTGGGGGRRAAGPPRPRPQALGPRTHPGPARL